MTQDNRQETLQVIMDTLGDVECDQLVNKLADKNIILRDDVTRITHVEEKGQLTELLKVLMEKGEELHPLVTKILTTYDSSSRHEQDPRGTDLAIEAVSRGSRNISESKETRVLSHTEVSQNWDLKNFLYELSQKMLKEEFDDMKDLMHGERGFKSSMIEKIDKPMKFFRQMMQAGYINTYNLHFLQALVRRIGRTDLYDDVREFCLRCQQQPIHFFSPSDEPENGCRYVKFHIEGSIDRLTHVQKERLRADVANILCVPITSVFIKGIEPADSLLFTFMVPEEDVTSFIHIYHSDDISFLHLSVQIKIHGLDISLSESVPTETKGLSPMFSQLKHLLESKESLEKQLEERDERLLDLQEEIGGKEGESTVEQVLRGESGDVDVHEVQQQCELYKSLFHRMLDFLKTMKPKDYDNDVQTMNGTLKLISASALYNSLLEQAKERSNAIDINLLNKLLDTRVLIETTIHRDRLCQLNGLMKMLMGQVEEQRQMNAIERTSRMLTGGSSTFLQDLLTIRKEEMRSNIHPDTEEITTVFGLHLFQPIYPGPLTPKDQTLLSSMTKELSKREKKNLKDFIVFSDAEKEKLQKYPDKLLELAFLRERSEGRTEPKEVILEDILARIKKKSLVVKYFSSTNLPSQSTKRSSSARGRKRGVASGTSQRKGNGNVPSTS